MPIKKTRGGWQYGNQKVFSTRKQALAQAAAIHISQQKQGKKK